MASKFFDRKNSKSDDSASRIQLADDLKALRTMLTMLSLIYKNSAVKSTENYSRLFTLTGPLAHELKVLTALATVLVMDKDKVAVVAKQDRAGPLNFIATANPRTDAEQEAGTYPTICNSKDKYYPNGAMLDQLKADVKQYW
jgi:hypothetical protein